MAEPFNNAVSLAETQIATALREEWDPRILDLVQRTSDLTKYLKPVSTPWPAGCDFMHIRVKDQGLRATRSLGNIGVANSTGVTLRDPPQTIGYDEWLVGQDDLMTYQCPVRYRFKTNEIIGASEIGPIARTLSEESMKDVMSRVEMGLLTAQSGGLALVAKMTNTAGAYSASPTTSATKFRLHLSRGAAGLFSKGDLIDLISQGGTYAYTLGTSAPSTHLEVADVNFDKGTSGVYGNLDCKPNPSAAAGTWNTTIANAASYWILLTGEYDTDAKPNAAPVDAATAKGIYGMRDWFRIGSSPGVIYNITRSTLGKSWSVPHNLNRSDAVIALSDITELLTMVYQHKTNDPELTEYVLMVGPRMAEKIVELVGVANRFLDGTAQNATKLVNNYGFNGTMIRCPAVGTAVGIQQIRGMEENRAYLLQPGVLKLIQPGGVQWMGWDDGGTVWHNESPNTSGYRTDVYRADRVLTLNSLIERPRLCGSLTGVRPD